MTLYFGRMRRQYGRYDGRVEPCQQQRGIDARILRAVEGAFEHDAYTDFLIVAHGAVERWSLASTRTIWWLLASMVARPVAQKWDGTSIYDVADPKNPKLLARLEIPMGWHSHKVRAANGLMLVNYEKFREGAPEFGGGLGIFDVSNPAKPRPEFERKAIRSGSIRCSRIAPRRRRPLPTERE